MKTTIQAAALLLFMPTLVLANTTHEIIVGLERDSSSEELAEENRLLTFGYSYYLSPLTNDAPHIDLQRFYQHPSQLNAGIGSIASDSEDRTDPANVINSDTAANVVTLGGEYYLPSNTGLLFGLGSGSGTISISSGTYQVKSDVDLKTLELGLRQYAARNVAFHIRSTSEEYSGDLSGAIQGSVKDKKSLVLLGTQAVFGDVVGLVFEAGRGEKESASPFSQVAGRADSYDVAKAKAELTFYGSKRFSILLGIDLDGQFQNAMPAGYGHEITENKVRLVPRYWFSENIGMEMGLYSVTTEELSVTPTTNSTTANKSSGVLIHLGYRF